MSQPLVRYLRRIADKNDIYIWTEMVSRDPGFEEIYARTVAEARVSGVTMAGEQIPNFEMLTKAQICAWVQANLDVELDLKKKTHSELVEEAKALIDERNQGALSDDSSTNADNAGR